MCTQLRHWAGDLAAEVCERLEEDLVENQRRAMLLTISYHYYQNKKVVSQTRSLALNSYKPERVASQCVDVVTKSTQCPVAYLGICASKFVPSKESDSFLKFFKNVNTKPESDDVICEADKSVNATDSFKSIIKSESNSEATEESDVIIIGEENSSPGAKEKESAKMKNSSAIKKSVATNSEAVIKGSKRIDDSLNVSMENSPTSKRVFKLIQECNERVKARSKNKRLSGLVMDNNDFQDSFFMNVYKTGKEEQHSNDIDAVEDTEGEEVQLIIKSDNIDAVEEPGREAQLMRNEKDTSENVGENNSKLCTRENPKPSTSCASTRVDNKFAKESNETCTLEPIARLREIFPNLSDMDPEVLSLLPADLQEAARSHMKSRDRKQESVKVPREGVKAGRGRPSKTKIARKGEKRRSPLCNFLIKTDSNRHDAPLERCAECDQMIALTKFSEHVDFHVAQNLYQEINKPASGEKRKLGDPEVVTAVKRQSPESSKLHKDSRSITTFLS